MTPLVQRLTASGRDPFLAHLLALPAEDVRLRFGTLLAPESIAAYAERIDFGADAVFAVHDDALAVVGAAHVGFYDGGAELGVSVLPGHRGLGLGSALLTRASEHARNRNAARLYMHCLAENDVMMRIARRAGMSIVVDAGEADAHLALPPASPASVTREYFTDQMALFDYALKSHVDALKKAADAVSRTSE